MCENENDQSPLTPERMLDEDDKAGPCEELDPNNEIDAIIIDEIEAIKRWAKVDFEVNWTKHCSTSAGCSYERDDFYISLNRKELTELFGNLDQAAFRSAIFFALAHECVHILQFRELGKEWVSKTPELHQEAAADLIAAVWMGFHILLDDRNVEQVKAAAAKLNSAKGQRLHLSHAEQGMLLLGNSSKDHPTSFQRTRLVAKGYSLAAGVLLLEDQMRKMRSTEGYTPAIQELLGEDAQDLHNIAIETLQFWPPQDPIK